MMSFDQLLQAHCQHIEGAPMTETEIHDHLGVLPDWKFRNGQIQRVYAFRDYFDTMAFVNALAWIAHREDHHPDLGVHFNRCAVAFNTHTVGGISHNDFICAAKADALYAQRPFV
ncbi:4a-hydroxytetrahydrobiopterin dehydratase [Thiomonas delicata]|uniref:Putative pterin-4-alpha-carbinolamine dehydratase n=1 Tax=Thiomonas delicata TaxID=364030 RepID=A0A238D617_THIDL|nr:putative pterin-4-alpha-carbinolamine dehydratase [Thiomonas delicata]